MLGINDAGQVVGTASSLSGAFTDYIATPTTVPEPQCLFFTAMPVAILLLVERNARPKWDRPKEQLNHARSAETKFLVTAQADQQTFIAAYDRPALVWLRSTALSPN